MVSFGYGLGAFGGGLMSGLETGLETYNTYQQMLGRRAFADAFTDAMSNPSNIPPADANPSPLGPLGGPPSQPMPGMPQMPGGGAPGWQQSLTPGQGLSPGTLPTPPPDVAQMGTTQVASADPGAFLQSPVGRFVTGAEGYEPRAKWDYKQYSGGYGTRATAGQSYTPERAASDLQDEWWKAKKAVQDFAPNIPQGPLDSLTDLTFNAGTKWQRDQLGAAVRAQNWPFAAQLIQQYNTAGGQRLPGLVSRRQEDARMMLGQPPSPQAQRAGEMVQARAAGGPPPEQQGPDRTDPKSLNEALMRLANRQPLELPHMAQLIERKNPNLSPLAKFYAIKEGMGLMNQNAQQQFNNVMQVLNYQKGLRAEERAEEAHQFKMTGGEAAQNMAQMISNYQAAPVKDARVMSQVYKMNPDFNPHKFAADDKLKQLTTLAEPKAIAAAMAQQEKQFEQVHGLGLFLDKNYKQLLELAKKVDFTGIPTIDGVIRKAKSALGGSDFLAFQTQLNSVMNEASKIMSGSTGQVLAEGARKELDSIREGNVTYKQLLDIYERVIKPDLKNREDSQRELITSMKERLGTGAGPPETVPGKAETTTPTTGAASAGGNDPLGIR